MNYIKSFLTGMICTLSLLSCEGNNNGEENLHPEVHAEICRHFKEYKSCANQAFGEHLLECDKTYEVGMKELIAKYGNAAISTKEGFNHQDARDTLNNCVKTVQENPEEEFRQCLLDFQNRVLEGLRCRESND